MDRSKLLCLACASSLPPSSSRQKDYTTPCCKRPICPSCLEKSNYRLARYDPCLACLGGVAIMSKGQVGASAPRNVDGAVKDEDTFVLGDDDDEVDEEVDEDGAETHLDDLPPYTTSVNPQTTSAYVQN